MRKVLVIALLFAAAFSYGQNVVTLDQAIENGAEYLKGRFPKGTRTAIITVQCENRELGEFVYTKLSTAIINKNWFTVVERSEAALRMIEREMNHQMSGNVSEETELSIGKQLGAQVLISGTFVRNTEANAGADKQNWRLDLQAVRIESAEKQAQWSGIVLADPAWVPLVKTAVSFSGDTISLSEKQTIISGLRNTLEDKKLLLEIEKSSDTITRYGINFIIYINSASGGFGLLQAELTVTFSQGKKVLFQAGPYQITETSEAMIARRVVEKLKADESFFSKIKKEL